MNHFHPADRPLKGLFFYAHLEDLTVYADLLHNTPGHMI
jgi:hypothetical protein